MKIPVGGMTCLGAGMMLLLTAAETRAADWPRFRGPNGSGVGEAAALPAEFGPGKNLAWEMAVPFGRSSPIVAGGRIFLTASEGDKLLTLAFDAATGKALWRREIQRPRTHKLYRYNDAASPTPVAGNGGVYAFFADFGLVSYTLEGKERWRLPLGPFDSFYGMAASPILAGGSVIQLCDQTKGSFLIAVDSGTGRQRWRVERPESPEGWSVPVVHEDQLLVFGSRRVDSYHLSTGETRWWMPVSSHGSMGTPVLNGESVIVAASGSETPLMPSFESTAAGLDKDKDGRLSVEECKNEKEWFEHFGWVDTNHDGYLVAAEWAVARSYGIGDYGAMAIPLNGKGRLEPTAVRWRVKRGVPYVAAPVLYEGVYYMVKDGGIISALEPGSGKLLKQGRSEKAQGQYFASPVGADGKVFLVSEEGKATVLKAGAQWEVLAVSDLGEETFATPAISGGRIIFRTAKHLYAFEAPRR